MSTKQREEGVVVVLLDETLVGPRRFFSVSADPIGDPTEPYRTIPIRPYPTGQNPTQPNRSRPYPTEPSRTRHNPTRHCDDVITNYAWRRMPSNVDWCRIMSIGQSPVHANRRIRRVGRDLPPALSH